MAEVEIFRIMFIQLSISCLAVVIAQVITPKFKWFWYYKIFMQSENTIRHIPSWKPFSCEACMGWWLGITWHLVVQTPTWYLSPFTGATCYVLSILITNALRRSV